MGQVTRKHEIRKRRARRNKIRKLRARLARAKNQTEIQNILNKIRKVHLFYPINQLTEGRPSDKRTA